MRILVFNYEYPPVGGGGGVGCARYARGWARRGHEVEVITAHTGAAFGVEDDRGVTVFRVPVYPRFDSGTTGYLTMLAYVLTATLFGLYRCLRHPFDVVNTHFALPSGPAGWTVSRLRGIPHVLTLVGGDVYDPTEARSPHRHPLLRWIVRFLCERSRAVISISRETRDRVREHHGVARPIDVIPYGLDPPDVTTWKPAGQLGMDPERFNLISIGRMVPRKGYRDLLEALKRIGDSSFHLHLIGEGPRRSDLEAMAEERSLSGRVFFRGEVRGPEKYHYLQAADCYVLSSLHEGLGIVVQEAMLCGLPIVATRCGGPEDLLQAPRNALIVDPGDPAALRDALEAIRGRESLRASMRVHNREDSLRFRIDRVCGEYLRLFERVRSRR